ncbi:hypothetical protein NDW01_07635 [Actinoallomurus sp. WRP6H-15]|nr:hypothetical protein [Actinoallomurus soli]MCO5968266.1 hypothetical protein [Actinoallomurus soli]
MGIAAGDANVGVAQDLLNHGEGYALFEEECRGRVAGGVDAVVREAGGAEEIRPGVPVAARVDRAAVRLAEHEIVSLPDAAGSLALPLLPGEVMAEDLYQLVGESDRLLPAFLDRPEDQPSACALRARGRVLDAVLRTEVLGVLGDALVAAAGRPLGLRAVVGAGVAVLVLRAFGGIVAAVLPCGPLELKPHSRLGAVAVVTAPRALRRVGDPPADHRPTVIAAEAGRDEVLPAQPQDLALTEATGQPDRPARPVGTLLSLGEDLSRLVAGEGLQLGIVEPGRLDEFGGIPADALPSYRDAVGAGDDRVDLADVARLLAGGEHFRVERFEMFGLASIDPVTADVGEDPVSAVRPVRADRVRRRLLERQYGREPVRHPLFHSRWTTRLVDLSGVALGFQFADFLRHLPFGLGGDVAPVGAAVVLHAHRDAAVPAAIAALVDGRAAIGRPCGLRSALRLTRFVGQADHSFPVVRRRLT